MLRLFGVPVERRARNSRATATKFTCNGKPHTATFAIDTVEKGDYGQRLVCVTKGEENHFILSKSGWVKVS